MNIIRNVFSAFLALMSYSIQAEPITVVGSTPITISQYSEDKQALLANKVVSVLKIRLSLWAQNRLQERIQLLESLTSNDFPDAWTATQVNLGMNNAKILDQGVHGSCVTFAVTALFNAAISSSDYASQLCLLELGSYLEKKGAINASGWYGTEVATVFKLINENGIIAKTYQISSGCAGMYQYPLNDENDIGYPMSISDYKAHAKKLNSFGVTMQVLASTSAFNTSTPSLLSKVKAALRANKRLSIGFLLDDSAGDAGSFGRYHQLSDTWVLTPSIIANTKANRIQAGHEVIVYGYDDNAVAMTSDGTISKGLLLLRNSWGSKVGDRGNYYMSYAYFQLLADEAGVVWKATPAPITLD